MLSKTLAHTHMASPTKLAKISSIPIRHAETVRFDTQLFICLQTILCAVAACSQFHFLLFQCIHSWLTALKSRLAGVYIYTIHVCMHAGCAWLKCLMRAKHVTLDMGFGIYYVNADCAKNDVEMNCFSVELQRTKVQCDCIESDNGLLFRWEDGSIVYLACNFLYFH